MGQIVHDISVIIMMKHLIIQTGQHNCSPLNQDSHSHQFYQLRKLKKRHQTHHIFNFGNISLLFFILQGNLAFPDIIIIQCKQHNDQQRLLSLVFVIHLCSSITLVSIFCVKIQPARAEVTCSCKTKAIPLLEELKLSFFLGSGPSRTLCVLLLICIPP